MSDFSKPEYTSYVVLCRELKLEHELGIGDWYFAEWGWPKGTEFSGCFVHDEDEPRDGVWLPSLSDWLEMLEEAGFGRVKFDNQRFEGVPESLLDGVVGPWMAIGDRDDFRTAPGNTNEVIAGAWAYGCGPTREEAAARLWMAVRKPAEVR